MADQGRYEEAEKICIESLRLRTETLGETHPNLLATMDELAFVLRRQGKHEEAKVVRRKRLEIQPVEESEEPSTALAPRAEQESESHSSLASGSQANISNPEEKKSKAHPQGIPGEGVKHGQKRKRSLCN